MSEIASLVAAAVAVVALYVSARTAFSQSQLQKRMLLIEEAREAGRAAEAASAQVEAHISGGHSNTRLELHNVGENAAHAISVLIDGKLAAEHPQFRGKLPSNLVLAPFSRHSFPLLTYDGRSSHFRIEVSWTSAAGVPGQWLSDVSVE